MGARPVRFAPPYALPTWPFVPPPELADGTVRRHPVVIVGGGLSGLALACDLALRGVPAVLLDEDDTVGARGASSRGIVYVQKSLEIFERLGIWPRVRDKGVTWSVGRTLAGDEEVYTFDRGVGQASSQPPFVNLQQFYIEWFLVDRLRELGGVDLRWKSRVTALDVKDDHVRVAVSTPAGDYALEADWLIDATGANSPIRESLGLDAHASRSADRWCITDVRFAKPLPTERWTWVAAPFNDGRAVWQHLMADDVWRIDYQMAPDCDPQDVARPEVAAERLRAQLGPDVDFEFVWIGPYQYRDHLLDDFRHGRVLFIGDAAHVVSPFGARGGNNGIQDAANLGWKLALVTQGRAPDTLLDSYSAERRAAALENLTVTAGSARFLAPRSDAERTLREAVLALAHDHPFARTLVNTGRMAVANDYPVTRWSPQGCRTVPNLSFARADGSTVTLMGLLAGGTRLLALHLGRPGEGRRAELAGLASRLPVQALTVAAAGDADLIDAEGRLMAHTGAADGDLLLIRPDGYLAARIGASAADTLAQWVRRALDLDPPCIDGPAPDQWTAATAGAAPALCTDSHASAP